MSLKYMHIFFITLSIGMSVAVGAWGIRAYWEPTGTAWHLALAVASILAGTTLWMYLAAFVQKARRIGLP